MRQLAILCPGCTQQVLELIPYKSPHSSALSLNVILLLFDEHRLYNTKLLIHTAFHDGISKNLLTSHNNQTWSGWNWQICVCWDFCILKEPWTVLEIHHFTFKLIFKYIDESYVTWDVLEWIIMGFNSLLMIWGFLEFFLNWSWQNFNERQSRSQRRTQDLFLKGIQKLLFKNSYLYSKWVWSVENHFEFVT